MFSRSSTPARPAKAGLPGLSFIGPEVTVNGDVATTGQLHVDGRVEGDVSCGSLCQGESGTIAGNIRAEQASLAGLVDGTLSAQTVVLEASARVTGDVSYDTISIAAGAQVEGRLSRRPAAAPAESTPALVAAPVEPKRPLPPANGLFPAGEAKARAVG